MGALAGPALLLAMPSGALGATIDVTTQADELTGGNGCSLREAISAANDNNTGPGGDCTAGDSGVADVVSVPVGHYTLTLGAPGENLNAGGDLDVTSDLTISGAGASSTTVDANALDRVFDIVGGTVELRDLTIRGGQTRAGTNGSAGGDHSGDGLPSTGGGGSQGEEGGGIRNGGNLTLTRVVVTNNAAGDGGDGGAGGPAGTGNPGAASTGGAGGFGGNGGGILSTGNLTLVDSHVTLNSAGNGGLGGSGGTGGTGMSGTATGGASQGGEGGFGGEGGGIETPSGSLTITDSLIDLNHAGSAGVSGQGGTGGTGGSGGGVGGASIGGNGRQGGFGGGISEGQTTVQITGSVIRGNFGGDGGSGGNGGTGGPSNPAAGPGGNTQGGTASFGGSGAGTPRLQRLAVDRGDHDLRQHERQRRRRRRGWDSERDVQRQRQRWPGRVRWAHGRPGRPGHRRRHRPQHDDCQQHRRCRRARRRRGTGLTSTGGIGGRAARTLAWPTAASRPP